jgi:hypothetical protein
MSAIYEVAQALREAAVMQVSIVSAFKPGDVIVIECDRWLSRQQEQCIRARIAEILQSTQIKIILLEPGMRLAAREHHTFTPVPNQ